MEKLRCLLEPSSEIGDVGTFLRLITKKELHQVLIPCVSGELCLVPFELRLERRDTLLQVIMQMSI